MVQPTIAAIRVALAAQLATIPAGNGSNLRAYANRVDQIAPPAVMIIPPTGTFISYGQTFEGSADLTLRAILVMEKSDSTSGQAAMDPYLEVAGSQSIYANLQANSTLGGVVQYAVLVEAGAYGPLTVGAIDYLGCQLTINVAI